MFHVSLNHEAPESTLTQDRTLCKNNSDSFSNLSQQQNLCNIKDNTHLNNCIQQSDKRSKKKSIVGTRF